LVPDVRVGGVGAHVVGARGDVASDDVPEAAGARGVRLLGDLELARLVLAEVVVGLAPPAEHSFTFTFL